MEIELMLAELQGELPEGIQTELRSCQTAQGWKAEWVIVWGQQPDCPRCGTEGGQVRCPVTIDRDGGETIPWAQIAQCGCGWWVGVPTEEIDPEPFSAAELHKRVLAAATELAPEDPGPWQRRGELRHGSDPRDTGQGRSAPG